MNSLVLYCRPGFEKECAAEIQDKAAAFEVFGYVKTELNTGYVIFHLYEEDQADLLARKVSFRQLIFARQMFVGSLVEDMPVADRIRPLSAVVKRFPKCGKLLVETADTNESRELSKLCRKFSVPLRQSLRKSELLTKNEVKNRPTLHVMFLNTSDAWVGYSYSYNNSPWSMGIPRLKFPSDAPSRSTLKLDEAFLLFIPENERDERVAPGMKAVDLGAAPGGWTYQLVKRDMFVSAVDNGPMDEALMETGQVKHFLEDGFKFVPKKHNITWLVCDMVENPGRVTELMAWWMIEEYCQEAIFNMKLPVKKRYEVVQHELESLKATLKEHHVRFELNAKQLFHDREEITVHLRRT